MRIKVRILCKVCGEKFILRGVKKGNQDYDTGFKTCICDNKDLLDIEEYTD